MKEVFVVADNVVSPIGKTAAENFEQLKKGISGVQQHKNNITEQAAYASLFKDDAFTKEKNFTKFEQLVIASVEDALSQTNLNLQDNKTSSFFLLQKEISVYWKQKYSVKN